VAEGEKKEDMGGLEGEIRQELEGEA